MVYRPVVHHPREAGAGLGGRLVDALPQGLQPEHNGDYCQLPHWAGENKIKCRLVGRVVLYFPPSLE